WHAYKANPIVFAATLNRMQLFREARFQWRQMRGGRPGDLFGSPELELLEHPWPGGSTSDLLAIAEVVNTCSGNFFCARRPVRGGPDRIRVMRPDWTRIILGSRSDEDVGPLDLDAEIVAYAYWNGGVMSGEPDIVLFPEQVCHWAPLPDPEAPYRGMSWLTPIVREITADKPMTSHKQKFMDAGATPNLAVKLNVDSIQKFNEWVRRYREEREEADVDSNPYRTLFLAAAADPVPIGTNLKDMDWSAVQSGGEVRIAAAAQVHPAVAGFQAGLQGSALNAGNFEAAFRQFANSTIRPNWRGFAQAVSVLVDRPHAQDGTLDASSELWYDDRDIPALAEDTVRASQIFANDADSASTLYMGGWDPDAVIDAVASKDLRRLTGHHSGEPSVQQRPGSSRSQDRQATRRNGSEPAPVDGQAAEALAAAAIQLEELNR
ncbi:MAG TPA: phage portal protein, partial [Solirubrobacterales bacterium]